MEGLVVGRVVQYVVAEGVIRPLIVVSVSDVQSARQPGCLNGVLFRDGSNDDQYYGAVKDGERISCVEWVTSTHYDPDKVPGTWHWPSR